MKGEAEAGTEAEAVEEAPEESTEGDVGLEEGCEDAFSVGGVVAHSADSVA